MHIIADDHQGYTAITIFCSPAEVVQHDVIVAAAEHPALHQPKFFPGGQLPLTGETGETGQVVHAAPSPSHPVAGEHLPATLGTLGAKPTVRKKRKVEGWLQVTGMSQSSAEYINIDNICLFFLHITARHLTEATVTFNLNTINLKKGISVRTEKNI